MQPLSWVITAVLSMQTPPAVEVEVSGAASPSRALAKPSAAALQAYAERCAVCHGDRGLGDGPAAKGLMTKPRRFSDAIWQDGVDDAHIQKAILEGGFAIKKSSAMPAHPDLKAQVGGLVQVVRSFRSQTGTVAVDAVAADGKVIATHSVDPNARGACSVRVPLTPVAPAKLVVRVAGRSAPACTLDVGGSPQRAACDAAAPRPDPPAPAVTPTAPTGADGPASADLSPSSNPAR